MNKYWFLGFIAWSITSFSLGAYTENKFNIAAQVGVANKQAVNLGQGQQNIIKFTQQWEKVDDKDPCNSELLPSAELKLLH